MMETLKQYALTLGIGASATISMIFLHLRRQRSESAVAQDHKKDILFWGIFLILAWRMDFIVQTQAQIDALLHQRIDLVQKDAR